MEVAPTTQVIVARACCNDRAGKAKEMSWSFVALEERGEHIRGSQGLSPS